MILPLRRLAAALLVAALPSAAAAQTTFALYGGWQGAGGGTASGTTSAGEGFDFPARWEGRPLSGSPYYGLRLTRFGGGEWGAALDFAHSKLYADDATRAGSGFSLLEFTHGLNALTLNAIRRFPAAGPLEPYLGFGAGITIPHVEVDGPGQDRTFRYQFGGPAIGGMAGARLDLGGRWSAFAEWRIHYVWLDVELDGGGRLRTDTSTNAANIGIGFDF